MITICYSLLQQYPMNGMKHNPFKPPTAEIGRLLRVVMAANDQNKVIELYHRMRGYRHGTKCDHRCDKCGGDMPSSDEVRDLREAKKVIVELRKQIAEHTCSAYEEDADSD